MKLFLIASAFVFSLSVFADEKTANQKVEDQHQSEENHGDEADHKHEKSDDAHKDHKGHKHDKKKKTKGK